MVTTPSIASDHETKRQRVTLEKSKVVTLSKQLQIRLQYARLKVEHGWQRQSLNEVENLYFHHSTLKGKSKALRPPSTARTTAQGPPTASTSTASDSPPKATSGHTKDGKAVSESSQAAHHASVTWSPGTVAPSSSPTVAASPHDALPSPSSSPIKSPSSRTTMNASTPGGTPAQSQASESARSVTLSSSVLSAFTQNFTTTQQLSREATMDFASLSPFVTASSFSGSGSSITAPSSFVSTVPPSPFASQTLAYQPSPFAPPPPSVPVPPAPSLPMSQFTTPPFPAAVQPSDISSSLETFPPSPQTTFPSLVQPHPSSPSPSPIPAPALAPTSASIPALASPPAPAPARSPVPAQARPPSSKRIRSPAPASTPGSPQKLPPSPSTHPHSLSSFRPSKTFDIPTAPGPVTSTMGTGTQSASMLTYDSFWSSHSSSTGGWRKAIVSNSSSSSSGNGRSPAASASTVTGGITATPASSAAGVGLLEVRGSSAKA